MLQFFQLPVYFAQGFVQGIYDLLYAFLYHRVRTMQPVLLPSSHPYELPAPGYQSLYLKGLTALGSLWIKVACLGKVGDHARIQPISLGQHPLRASEVPDLPRVHYGHRNLPSQCFSYGPLIASGGLHCYQCRLQSH